ncbi:MAG TPA: hypothetical protein VM694_07815 [Polyangium sp.]|nr:hypothetical protein [Polyangium sp.]
MRSDCPRGAPGGRDVECAIDEGGGDVGGGGIVETARGTCGADAGSGVRRGCVDGAHERGAVEGGGCVAPRENPTGDGGSGVERPCPEAGIDGGGTEAGGAGRAAGGGGVGVGPRCGGGEKNRLPLATDAGLSSGFVTGAVGSRATLGSPF